MKGNLTVAKHTLKKVAGLNALIFADMWVCSFMSQQVHYAEEAKVQKGD